MLEYICGDTVFRPVLRGDDTLATLGSFAINGKPMRNEVHRFLPWFDTYDGIVFDAFRLREGEQAGESVILHLTAIGRQDYPFQERRDMSGDICLRTANWDAAPMEAAVTLRFNPVRESIDGHAFSGFSYEAHIHAPVPIHRYLDRQTWEPGGHLHDHQICCRNWARPPRCRIGIHDEYSTAGLDVSSSKLAAANPMPGNLWARWSLLPGFDMIYGSDGCLLTWFDRVSLIRSVIETLPGESCLRIADLHLFEADREIDIPPKTVAWSPDLLGDVEAVNLWTRMTDRDRDLARRQFQIPEEDPPLIECGHTNWINMSLDNTYEQSLSAAAKLGMEVLFIDSIWENAESYNMELHAALGGEPPAGSLLAKRARQSMCCTTDFRVAESIGGEAALKRLCERAAAHGIRIVSWMATHLNPSSALREHPPEGLAVGQAGLFAARESGRHPDTGYPGDCWPLNLNAPVMEYVRDQILGVCQKTGLAGFLWDSFSNLGWWQIDYSTGTMRPQFGRMATLYADLSRAGLYLMPEGIASFSNHCCLGLLHAQVMEGEMAAFCYNSATPLPHPPGASETLDMAILRGKQPIAPLFRLYAHKCIPNSLMQYVPESEWDTEGLLALQQLFAIYKQARCCMHQRTVLPDDLGVDWTGSPDARTQRWVFTAHSAPAMATDLLTGTQTDSLQPNRVYWLEAQ